MPPPLKNNDYAEWYPCLYVSDGPTLRTAPCANSTATIWEAAGKPPPGSRLDEGHVLAHFASGEAIPRYSPALPMIGTTGQIEALPLWAGQSVALATKSQPAADIVAELISRL